MAETEIVIPESFYFHGDEINQFIHIQVPIALIKEKVLKYLILQNFCMDFCLTEPVCLSKWLD